MTDKQIECALSQCGWSTDKYTRCKNCPYNDGSPCITNLHLDTLKYIESLKQKNAELRLRLDKTLFPFAIGDKAYTIEERGGMPQVVEREIIGIEKIRSYNGECIVVKVKVDKNDIDPYGGLFLSIQHYNKDWWLDKAVAEKELNKLTGNNNGILS